MLFSLAKIEKNPEQIFRKWNMSYGNKYNEQRQQQHNSNKVFRNG